jgi:hypothetical protein
MTHRLLNLLWRVAAVAAIAAVAALLPLPIWSPDWVMNVHVPLAVFLFVCISGKLILDTFFYPRYP